jgi:abortive infection bacteriophage resistance protein
MQRQKFTKLPTTIDEQIALLKERGMQLEDESFVYHCLSTVSYYRLSAYIKPYEIDKLSHKLNPQIGFSDVWNLYVFDRELRLLFMDALERIEVALRTSLINVMSNRYDAWWYLQKDLFKSAWFLINPKSQLSPADAFKNEIKSLCKDKTPEGSINHFYKKYNEPGFPPSWMVFEYLSFGKCTSLFRYLKYHQDKSEICKIFKFHPNIVESGIEALRYTRNICAHHARLWDKWFVYKPRYLKELANANCAPGTLKEQIALLMLFHMSISPHSSWKNRLFQLFEKHMTASVPIKLMGFDLDWKNDAVWKM